MYMLLIKAFEILILISFDVIFVTKLWTPHEILIIASLIMLVSCEVFEIWFASVTNKSSRKHPRAKATPSLHLRYSKKRNLG